MALIGKIRNNSWLLIVLIGLGLGGFILMDMMSGQQSVFGQSQNVIGSIEGQKVDANEFYKAEEALYAGASGDVFSRRSTLWNYFVEDAIIKEEAEALGLSVSKSELMDLQFGNNLSPVINARFLSPTTRQVDRNQLSQIKNAIETNQLNPQYRAFWAHQEKEIIKERLQSKLNALVSKAIYTPTWMAEQYHIDQSQLVDFAYVRIPFAEVNDADIEVSDADYKAYLNDNKSRFVQDEETRTLDYVVFDVEPSAEDSADLRAELVEMMVPFSETEDDSLYVTARDGIIDGSYIKRDRVSPEIADQVFSVNPGTVIAPYEENGLYNIAKVIDRMVIPDSVNSRHILRTASSQVEFAQALSTIDSLKRLIENGTSSFDSLALKFSQDPSNASTGGNLGNSFEGKMVKPFNDLIFYTAKVGELNTVITQFGVHLVEVLDRTYITNEEGVKLAYINKPIIPSVETQKIRYQAALEFVGNNRTLEAMTEAANAAGMEVVTSPPLKSNDFSVGALGAGQSSRDMIKWAFTESVGKASPSVYVFQNQTYFSDDKYVAVGLSGIQEAGDLSVATFKDQIDAQVRNLKKAEVIKGRITAGQNLAALASTFNSQIDTLRSVNFNSSIQPGLGDEPKVISAAFNLSVNGISAPVVGESGVYVVQVINKPDPGSPTNIPQLRTQAARPYQGQVSSQLIEGMKKTATIKDYRSNFY